MDIIRIDHYRPFRLHVDAPGNTTRIVQPGICPLPP
jgi:hypothetical protein